MAMKPMICHYSPITRLFRGGLPSHASAPTRYKKHISLLRNYDCRQAKYCLQHTLTTMDAYTQPNLKDSMKSTWRTDKSQWGFWHTLCDLLSIHPTNLNRETPVHSKADPVPWLSDWQMEKWTIAHAFLPLALQQLIVWTTGYNFGRVAAFFYYSYWFKAIAIHQIISMRNLGHIYGFFDGDKHARDEVPDISVGKVMRSLLATSSFRPLISVMFAYSKHSTPASINWLWLPIEIGLYGIILDFWFYW
jgi:hypothetical protein